MTIEELINHIPFEILKRGQNYFQNGNILHLNKGSNGTWYAEVEGNYGNYQVEIETDNKSNVTNYYCDYRGFIDYRSSHKAMNDVTQFQIKADDY